MNSQPSIWDNILGAANKLLQGLGIEQKPTAPVQQVTPEQPVKQPPLVANPNTWAAYQTYTQSHPGYVPPGGFVTPNGQPITIDQARAMATQPNAISQTETSSTPQVQSPQVTPQSPTPPMPATSQPQVIAPSMPPSTYQSAQSQSQLYGRNPGTNPKKIPSNVQDAINNAADYYKVPRSLMYDMASAESSFNPANVNNTPDGVKAGYPTGLYQFTTQPGVDSDGNPMSALWDTLLGYGKNPASTLHLPNGGKTPYDPVDNAYGAAYLISHGQLGRWDASDGNWGKFYTPQELENQGFYKEDTTHTPGKFYYQKQNK